MRIWYATRHLVRTAWFIWRGGWESLSESVCDNWRTVRALLLQFKLDLREPPPYTGEPPPFHPNCRCFLWPSYDKGHGVGGTLTEDEIHGALMATNPMFNELIDIEPETLQDRMLYRTRLDSRVVGFGNPTPPPNMSIPVQGFDPNRCCPVCGDLMTNGVCRMSTNHE